MSNADHVTGRCQFLGSRTHPTPVLFSPALFPTARHVNFLLFIMSQLAGVTSREQGLFCFCCVLSKRPVSNMQSILTEHLLDSDIKASTPLGSVVKHRGSRAPGPGCRHSEQGKHIWKEVFRKPELDLLQDFNPSCLGD